MKIIHEIALDDFEAWQGGKDTLDRVKAEGQCEQLEELLSNLYPDGVEEKKLNDILRFEADYLYEQLGIPSEEEILEQDNDEIDICDDY